jgi:hypothetical protein
MSLQELGRTLLALGVIAVLTGTAANAQNLDQGKSAARLFADSCATCHRSARGLAKGRFNFTLYLFLKEHYASNSDSAWALTSYLESVDSHQRGQPRVTRGRCGTLLLHRDGLAPSTPCRSPGALRFTPDCRHVDQRWISSARARIGLVPSGPTWRHAVLRHRREPDCYWSAT